MAAAGDRLCAGGYRWDTGGDRWGPVGGPVGYPVGYQCVLLPFRLGYLLWAIQ